jgi:hypothetical protein
MGLEESCEKVCVEEQHVFFPGVSFVLPAVFFFTFDWCVLMGRLFFLFLSRERVCVRVADVLFVSGGLLFFSGCLDVSKELSGSE